MEYDLAGQVIGLAMRVHSKLGAGFLESVYQNALLYELRNAGFEVEAEVRLSVKVEDGAMLFIVADRGPGIPPESIPFLFEKFYRAGSAKTRTGAGLGLAICKAIVDSEEGRIEIESAVGLGTKVTVRFPGAAVSNQAVR